jgi:hypothetical protein
MTVIREYGKMQVLLVYLALLSKRMVYHLIQATPDEK